VTAARFEPPATDASEPFWDATRQQRYLVQWCTSPTHDAAPVFYPREVCPTCLSADHLEWRASSGNGTVHAVSVQYRPANPTMADKVPYAVALVDLDAGQRGAATGDGTIRVMSNVVNCDPTDVAVGQPVRLTWELLSDGRNLPLFEPAKES
jgi:uncharacterized OB-fold protein